MAPENHYSIVRARRLSVWRLCAICDRKLLSTRRTVTGFNCGHPAHRRCTRKNRGSGNFCIRCGESFNAWVSVPRVRKSKARKLIRRDKEWKPDEEKSKVLQSGERKVPKQRANAGKKQKLSCTICGKVYSHRSTLYNHEKQHENNKVFCESCDCYIGAKRNKNRHENTPKHKRNLALWTQRKNPAK